MILRYINSYKHKYIQFHIYICFQHVQTDPPTKEGLAQLVIQLIQYQENKLGKNATDPPFMRLPVSITQCILNIYVIAIIIVP